MKETMKIELVRFSSFEAIFDSEKEAKKLGRELARAIIATWNSLERFDKIPDKDLWDDNRIEFEEEFPGFSIRVKKENGGKFVLEYWPCRGGWERIVDYVLGDGYSKRHKIERLEKTLDELRK